MLRREFIAGAGAVAGLAALPATGSEFVLAQEKGAEFYELRQYHLHQGAKPKRAEEFWRDAGIPALKRLGIGPVGVFNVVIGPESPTLFVLIPHKSAESVVTLPARLADDVDYQKAGAAFLNAPLSDPSYARLESALLASLSGMARLEAPPAAAEKKPRLFELRTYECHGEHAAAAKADMFNQGEIGLFRQAGFHPVFFSQSVIGKNVPNITYMLSFEDLAARDRCFAAFGANPEFRRLAALPKYTDLLTNITNTILRPTAFSEI